MAPSIEPSSNLKRDSIIADLVCLATPSQFFRNDLFKFRLIESAYHDHRTDDRHEQQHAHDLNRQKIFAVHCRTDTKRFADRLVNFNALIWRACDGVKNKECLNK